MWGRLQYIQSQLGRHRPLDWKYLSRGTIWHFIKIVHIFLIDNAHASSSSKTQDNRKTQPQQRHKRTLRVYLFKTIVELFSLGGRERKRYREASLSLFLVGCWSKHKPCPSYHKFLYIFFDTSSSKFDLLHDYQLLAYACIQRLRKRSIWSLILTIFLWTKSYLTYKWRKAYLIVIHGWNGLTNRIGNKIDLLIRGVETHRFVGQSWPCFCFLGYLLSIQDVWWVPWFNL